MNTLVLLVSLFPLQLPNLWAIWHAFSHRFQSSQERLVWILVAVFIPCIGGVVYLLFGRKRCVGRL